MGLLVLKQARCSGDRMDIVSYINYLPSCHDPPGPCTLLLNLSVPFCPLTVCAVTSRS